MRHGFLLVDKPAGPTSHDVVGRVRKTLGERDIGHLGTLDPAATGLLVLAVGKKALKVVELFNALPKEYEATLKLGAVSTTYDGDGTIEELPLKAGWELPEQATTQRIIAERFLGKISQVPPAFSAIKIGGERAYRKARQGRNVELAARDVEIKECAILEYGFPVIRLRVACGSGTYVRSLAHDLGQLLRCGAYLSALRRTKVGDWSVTDAVAPDAAQWSNVRPLKDVLTSFPRRDLTADEFLCLQHGKDITGPVEANTIGWLDDLPVALIAPTAAGMGHGRKVF